MSDRVNIEDGVFDELVRGDLHIERMGDDHIYLVMGELTMTFWVDDAGRLGVRVDDGILEHHDKYRANGWQRAAKELGEGDDE